MPTRSLDETTTPRPLACQASNTFEKSFIDPRDLYKDELDNWIVWQGMDELEANITGRTYPTASSTYTCEPWSTNLVDIGEDIISSAVYSPPMFFFNDETFQPDEAKLSFPLPPIQQLDLEPALQSLQNTAPYRAPVAFAEESLSSQDTSECKITSTTTSPSSSSSYHSVTQKRTIKNRKLPRRGPVSSSGSQSRKSHNAIEKRYRTSVNDSINRLRQAIPPVIQKKSDSRSVEENEGPLTEKGNRARQQKDGKGAVLVRALEYIKQLEANTKRLCSESDALDRRLGAFEILGVNGTVFLDNDRVQP